jgi:hypothetical protein
VSDKNSRNATRKSVLAHRLDQAHQSVIKNLENMLRVLVETGDGANAMKIKQAILTVQVTYNRARYKL